MVTIGTSAALPALAEIGRPPDYQQPNPPIFVSHALTEVYGYCLRQKVL